MRTHRPPPALSVACDTSPTTYRGARYLGADRGVEFGRRGGVPGEPVVRLRPLRAVADPDVTGRAPGAPDVPRGTVAPGARDGAGPIVVRSSSALTYPRVSWSPAGTPRSPGASQLFASPLICSA